MGWIWIERQFNIAASGIESTVWYMLLPLTSLVFNWQLNNNWRIFALSKLPIWMWNYLLNPRLWKVFENGWYIEVWENKTLSCLVHLPHLCIFIYHFLSFILFDTDSMIEMFSWLISPIFWSNYISLLFLITFNQSSVVASPCLVWSICHLGVTHWVIWNSYF